MSARDADIWWHQTFCPHSLPVPHERPGSLGKGSISPWWCKCYQKAPREQPGCRSCGSTPAAHFFSLCSYTASSPGKIILAEQSWFVGWFVILTPTSFAISDAFPLIAGQTWERGAPGCSRSSAWRWSQIPSVGSQGKASHPVQHRHHDKGATTWE